MVTYYKSLLNSFLFFMQKFIGFLAFYFLFISLSFGHKNPLPLGDGYISTYPKVNYIYSCQTKFGGLGGAQRVGDWIVGDKWYPDSKPKVQGSVAWPEHYFKIINQVDKRVVTSNDLPDHNTGIFPIQRIDPAYYYDRNPNSIYKQNIVLNLPIMPKLADNPSCLPMGLIGIALTGVAIFNGLDGEGRDAAAHEIQDSCNGHPEMQGAYHYHNLSPCMKDNSGKEKKHSDLVGYALDGFGIYGQYGEGGKSLSNKDLDACHGHSHVVFWNGVPQEIYHYHLTMEYPYTLGCFKGVVNNGQKSLNSRQDGPWNSFQDSTSQSNIEKQINNSMPSNHRQVLEKVAQELDLSVEDLRRAMGPPPPNFSLAASKLGISEQKLRNAFDRARKN